MSEFKNIKGGKELQAFLDQLPAKMEANILRAALRAGANVIKEEAKANVPVKDGDLRDSIRVTTRLRYGVVTASVKAGNRRAWYWRFVEFGTAAHFIKATRAKALVLRANKRASSGFANRWMSFVLEGVNHPGAQAKPFMRPAMDSKANEALQAVGEAIKKRLTKQGLNTADIDFEVEE